MSVTTWTVWYYPTSEEGYTSPSLGVGHGSRFFDGLLCCNLELKHGENGMNSPEESICLLLVCRVLPSSTKQPDWELWRNLRFIGVKDQAMLLESGWDFVYQK